MVDYTVRRLIDTLERRASFPIQQNLYTEEDFIDFLNSTITQKIVPEIMSVRETFFETHVDYTIVSGQAEYEIPTNAIAQKVKAIQLVDTSKPNQDAIYNIPRTTLNDVGSQYHPYSDRPQYYMSGNTFTLYPTPENPPANTVLRVVYFAKPAELVPYNQGAVITAIDTVTGQVTVNSVPATWTTNTSLDVTKGKPPFNLVQTQISPSGIINAILTFTPAIASTLSVGDTLAEEQFSIIPQLPMIEAHRLLESGALVRVLQGAADDQALAVAAQDYAYDLRTFLKLITPRDETQNVAITNPGSAFDATAGWGWFR